MTQNSKPIGLSQVNISPHMWNLSESPLHLDLGFFVNRNKNEVIFGERWGFLVCEDIKIALLFNIPLR